MKIEKNLVYSTRAKAGWGPLMRHFLLLAGCCCCISAGLAHAQGAADASHPRVIGPYSIEKLHRAYMKRGQDSLKMSQYDKNMIVSGVVLEVSTMLSAGATPDGDELARLSPYDKSEQQYMKKLQPGQEFKAICTLGPTMNTDWMALMDCVFK